MPADDPVTSLTGSVQVRGPGSPHLPLRIRALCWRLRANRQQRKRRWRNFAARIGDPSSPLCGGKGFHQRRQRILPRVFLHSYWSAENSVPSEREKGRLRSFLLGALKYFLADEQRRAMAIKRGKGQRLILLEELRADERVHVEPADPVTAEMIYERRWALTVLERVLSRLKVNTSRQVMPRCLIR
jgi:hypothetical protein